MFLYKIPFIMRTKGVAMRENLLNKRENNIKTAEKYISKYLYDLQKYFSLNNTQVIKILHNCLLKLKKENHEKKWWQFFKKNFII